MIRWIFDLDGTLTRPVHNFDELCDRLSLPPNTPILEAIESAEPIHAEWLKTEVEKWEWEAAEKAELNAGVWEFFKTLKSQNIAILTRNKRAIAVQTLKAIGLYDRFIPQTILGRDEAEPKPSPEGILRILTSRGWSPDETVMVGDYLYDLQAGRRANVKTVLIDADHHGQWAQWCDFRVRSFSELTSVSQSFN